MRVVLASGGTEGDIQPLLAVGRGLKARGHDVRFGAVPVFHDLVRRSGLEPVSLGDYDPRNVVLDIARSNPRRSRLTTARQRLTPAIPDVKFLAQYLGLCREADVVMYTPISGYAYHTAEALGIPVIEVQLLPLTPTWAFPSPHAPVPSGAGALVNRLSYALPEVVGLVNRGWTNDWRRTLGLRPIPLVGPQVMPFFREKRRVICAISPAVVRRPREWPDAVELTGYLFASSLAYSPPDDLVAFLEEGSPPVCISLGSTVESDPDALRPILGELQKQTGRRMVVVRGWGNYALPERSRDVFILERASYSWLYPRVAAVVHHAGTGTAAEAVRAGVPSVCLPFITEQRFWAARLADLGVSPRPVSRRDLTARLLAEAIEAASDPLMASRARSLGSIVRAEDGVSAAVDVVERVGRARFV